MASESDYSDAEEANVEVSSTIRPGRRRGKPLRLAAMVM